MKIRNVFPLAILCLAIMSFSSIPSSPQKAGKGATSTIIDLAGEYNTTCGERINVVGSMHVIQHAVVNKNKTTITFISNYQGVSGFGAETGQRYIIQGRRKNTETITLNSGQQHFTMWFTENLVAPGKGVINFSVKGYFTISASGEILAQDFDMVFCQ